MKNGTLTVFYFSGVRDVRKGGGKRETEVKDGNRGVTNNRVRSV